MAKSKQPEKIQLDTLIPNPKNPRIIKDSKFKKLVKSIEEFPKMLSMRPIIIDENRVILGGNMRFAALKHIGITEVEPDCVSQRFDLTEDEKKEFLIKDNLNYGEWDTEELANEWDHFKLDEWGADVPSFEPEEPEPESSKAKDRGTKWFLNIEFESESDAEHWFNKLKPEGFTMKIINDKPFLRTVREK
jgi:hypothetical protein